MKALSLLFVGVLLPLFYTPLVYSDDEIFQLVTPVTPQMVPTCMVGEYAIDYFLLNIRLPQSNEANGLPRDTGTYYSGEYKPDGKVQITVNGDKCYASLVIKQDYWQYSSSTGEVINKQERFSSVSENGLIEEGKRCPPDSPNATENNPYENFTYMHDYNIGDGSEGSDNFVSMCFDPQDLVDVDSCPDSTGSSDYIQPVTSSAPSPLMCQKKDDGSICAYELDSSGEFYKSSFENTRAYGSCGFEGTELDPVRPDQSKQCTTLGDGSVMCVENENAMCPNGQCKSGCGTYAFGDDEETFVCFSTDTDSDGVPDYSDIDLDGDGIPNEQDEDWDGDGENDPAYDPDQNNGTGGSGSDVNLSTVEGLLAQIRNNTASGSSGSGASQAEIEEALKESLIEQGEFGTADYESDVDAKTASRDAKIDEFNDQEKLQFQNAIAESGIADDLSINEYFTGGCSATFQIPLTGKSLDLCEPASKAQPFLYVIFAFSTFLLCTREIITTVRGTN